MKWPEEKNNLARRFRISFSSRKKKGTVQSKGLTDRIVGNPEVMAKVLINAEVHFGPGDFTGLRTNREVRCFLQNWVGDLLGFPL